MKNRVHEGRMSMRGREGQSPLDAIISSIAELVVEAIDRKLQSAPMVRPRLLTVEGAATYLGRTPSAIKSMVATKKLIPVRIDDRLCFDVQELDRIIEAAKEAHGATA